MVVMGKARSGGSNYAHSANPTRTARQGHVVVAVCRIQVRSGRCHQFRFESLSQSPCYAHIIYSVPMSCTTSRRCGRVMSSKSTHQRAMRVVNTALGCAQLTTATATPRAANRCRRQSGRNIDWNMKATVKRSQQTRGSFTRM